MFPHIPQSEAKWLVARVNDWADEVMLGEAARSVTSLNIVPSIDETSEFRDTFSFDAQMSLWRNNAAARRLLNLKAGKHL